MAKLVQKSLNDVDYPASKQDWIVHAKNNRDENEEAIQVPHPLPDKEYRSPVDGMFWPSRHEKLF